MKKIILLGLGILLIGAGCTTKSNNNSTISAKSVDYQIQVIKSETNINTLYTKAKNPATMKEILSQPEVKFSAELRGGKETVTMLDSVLATASKSWNLYINGQKNNFIGLEQVEVKPGDKIEWKYETTQ